MNHPFLSAFGILIATLAHVLPGTSHAACSAVLDNWTITETERWSDYGVGEPVDGRGITRTGSNIVREGANFDITFELKAECVASGINPEATISISGGGDNWDVFGSWNGTKTGFSEAESWNKWYIHDTNPVNPAFTFTLPWTLSGTTRDDNCYGGGIIDGPTVTISLHNRNTVPSLMRVRSFRMSILDDDLSINPC